MLESCARLKVLPIEAVLRFVCGAAPATHVGAGVHEAGSRNILVYEDIRRGGIV